MSELQLNTCKCTKCQHEWIARSESKKPVACPACKRRDWDGVHNSLGGLLSARVALHCGKCGYDWAARRAGVTPQACPACKRYDWQKITPQAKCFMCGGKGCAVCVPPAAVGVSIVPGVLCRNCHDRGMRKEDGTGCPVCGRVYVSGVVI